jgi:outer membrane protein insertion porin family
MIEEGKRYQIGAVEIDSQFKDVQKDDLREVVETESDTRFNEELVDKSVDNLTERLSDLGYAFVDINAEYDRDVENSVLNIKYRVKEGPRVYINRINVSGNVRTLDKVIRREFRLSEGDPFNAAKIRRSRQRIQNLGFFSEVKVDSKRAAEPDKANIDVEVKEKSTGELNFGAGYSTTDGALGNVSVREKNLLGKGQDLRLSFQRSARGASVDLGFTEPYFMDRDIAAGFDLFSTVRNYEDESSYDSETQGGTLRASYSLTEHLRHTLSYSLKNVDISDVPDTASTFVKQQQGETTTSSVAQVFLYDKRDDRFNPTEGYFIRLKQELAGLGGDTKYLKHEFKTGNYYPVYREDVVFMVGTKAGNVFGYDDEDVRINDRFFIGGTTIRGFDTSGIGPRDSGSNSDALGGNNYYATTAELTFPLGMPEELGVKGKTFVDAGTLYDVDDVGITIQDESSIRASVGAGITWNSPMGPIGITYAHPFAKEKFDDTKKLDFNFGTRF